MSTQREVISTAHAPAAIGPYSQAIRSGDFVFTAGQIPLVPETGKLAEGGIEAQTHQVMKNLDSVLKAAGTTLGHVVKTTIFVTDLGNFAAINQVYGSYFNSRPPARSTVQVAGLPLGASVEIEVIALVSQE